MSEVEPPPEPAANEAAEGHVPDGFEEPPVDSTPEPTPEPEPITEPVPSDGVEGHEHADEADAGYREPAEDDVEASEQPDVMEAAVDDAEPDTELDEVDEPPAGPRELGDPEEPHLLVIESLRTQVTALMQQVGELNTKLIKSYDRVSDLEDDLHVTGQTVRASKLKITALELERSEHLAALNTGLLVEKESVTQELRGLMQRVTEEAAQRGEAESAKQAIESDLDDLSATLFVQANSMVAEARLDRARAARRLAECEEALKDAEDVVASVQLQMQGLREEKEKSDREMGRMKELMGKGKYVESKKEYTVPPVRLMKTHLPFKEFIDFITHLRSIRPTAQNPPHISTLTTLPFLTRLIIEDTDPTVRFDFAPSLTWLTRRSFTNAVQQGLLLIEPLHTSNLLAESASVLTFASSEVLCGLCGCSVFGAHGPGTPGHPLGSPALKSAGSPKPVQQPTPAPVSSWSASRFLKTNPLNIGSRSNSVPTISLSPSASPGIPSLPDAVIFVFRLSTPATQKPASPYPLCQSGWCLQRLRTSCELWSFVRRGVIDRVWENDIPAVDKSPPPVPPPRKRMGFWGSVPVLESGPVSPAPSTERILPTRRHSESPSAPVTPLPRRVPPPPTPEMLGRRVHAVPPLPNGTNGSRTSADIKPLLPQRKSTEPPAPDSTEEETASIITAVPTGSNVEESTDGSANATVVEAEVEEETIKRDENGDSHTHQEALESVSEEAEVDQSTSVTVVGEEAVTAVSADGEPAQKPSDAPKHADTTEDADIARPSTPPQTAATDSPSTPSAAPPPRPPRRAGTKTRRDGTTSGSSPSRDPVSLPSDGEGTPRRSTDVEQEDFMSAPSSPGSKPTSPGVEPPEPGLKLSALEDKRQSLTKNGVTVAETLPQVATVRAVEARSEPPHMFSPPPRLPPRRAAAPKALPPAIAPIQVQDPTEEVDTVDSNWEEKAWRELVRLKEDMFMARIGAARLIGSETQFES